MSADSDYDVERINSAMSDISIPPRARSTTTTDAFHGAVISPQLRPYKSSPLPLRSKPKQRVTAQGGVVDEYFKTYVRTEFQDRIHREYPVVDFIRAVWNYEPKDIPDRAYSLPSNIVNNYCRTTGTHSYVYLVELLEIILAQVYPDPITAEARLPTDARVRTVGAHFVNMRDGRVDEDYANFRPDLVLSTTSVARRQRWEWYEAYAEVKKSHPEEIHYTCDIPVGVSKLKQPMVQKVAGIPVQQCSIDSQVDFRGTKRKGSPCSAEIHDTPRKRARYDAGQNPTQPPTPRSKQQDERAARSLNGSEIQSAIYINEMMSHGIRSHASGIFVEDLTMKLWYADRMGLVTSKPFHMLLEPEKLLLVVAAMGAADLSTMGVCPFLKFPSASFNSYKGVRLVFPAKLLNEDEEEEEVEFAWDTSRKLDTDYGAIGRGTTIVPIKTTPTSAARFGDEDLVAKVAWPPASHDAEDRLIRVVRHKVGKKKPQYLKHIVDLKCSITRTMEQMRLPRAFMNNLLDYEPRVFRMVVMKKYERLEQVRSVDEFKKIFLDVVRAHHWVWETSSVLHRDISVNNIMFYRTEDRTFGVLCDWDLAVELSHDDEAADDYSDAEYSYAQELDADAEDAINKGSSKMKHVGAAGGLSLKKNEQPEEDQNDPVTEARCEARYRTGTGPFMALELLSPGEPPLHRYRFDVESFFFVLVWFVALFKPDTNTFGHVFEWEHADLYTIGSNKLQFYTSIVVFRRIFANAHATYRPLIGEWVKPLYGMFTLHYATAQMLHAFRMQLEQAHKNGNQKEQAKLIKQIDQKKASLRKDVTYERFMKRLHATIDVED